MIDTDKYYYKPKYPTDGQEELFNNAIFRENYKHRQAYGFSVIGDVVWRLHTKELKQLVDHWLDMEQDTVLEGTDYTEMFQELEEGLFYVLYWADNTHADYAKQWERVAQLLTMTPYERAGVIEGKPKEMIE